LTLELGDAFRLRSKLRGLIRPQTMSYGGRQREVEVPKLAGVTADRLADEFVNYLFDEYQGSRHVRRVASWIGFVVCGIAQIRDGSEWDIPRERQLRFMSQGSKFVAGYEHDLPPRGGIVFREVLPGRGAPKGPVLLSISSLKDAERFYRNPDRLLRSGK
jgi:hypothetical protein